MRWETDGNLLDWIDLKLESVGFASFGSVRLKPNAAGQHPAFISVHLQSDWAGAGATRYFDSAEDAKEWIESEAVAWRMTR